MDKLAPGATPKVSQNEDWRKWVMMLVSLDTGISDGVLVLAL